MFGYKSVPRRRYAGVNVGLVKQNRDERSILSWGRAPWQWSFKVRAVAAMRVS